MTITKKLSPNFSVGRQETKIDRVVIHWIGEGTADSAATWFANDKADVSAHYIVGNSKVYQCVEEKDTAWHAGNWNMNLRSIGIEHEAIPQKPATDAVYKKSAELIADISKRYGIPLDRTHIIGHKEVVSTACPGTMDIDKLISMAKELNMDENESLEDKIAALEDDILGLRASRNSWREKYEELEEKYAKEIASKNSDFTLLQKANQELTANLTRLTVEVNTLTEKKNALEGIVRSLEANQEAQVKLLKDNLETSQKAVQSLNDEITKQKVLILELKKQTLDKFTKWELFLEILKKK